MGIDIRLQRVLVKFKERQQEQQSSVVHRIGASASEKKSFYRLLGNGRIGIDDIKAHVHAPLQYSSQGKDVLVACDTTCLDYSFHKSLRQDGEHGPGFIGNHRGLGYWLHTSLGVDASDGSVLGIADVRWWARREKKQVRSYSDPWEKGEGHRWWGCCRDSAARMPDARSVTYVQDREGDIYGTFHQVQAMPAGQHLLVRSRTDRRIRTVNGESRRLRGHIGAVPFSAFHQIRIQGDVRKGTKTREARLGIRYDKVFIQKGTYQRKYEKEWPKELGLWAVQAVEVDGAGAPVKDGVDWVLLTTHQVGTPGQAWEKVQWYTRRWIIEDFFRLLKKDGFQVERTEIRDGLKLQKLILLTMDTAASILQLRQARDGDVSVPIEAVFDEGEQKCPGELCGQLEGSTVKLSNPHTKQTLPWATWIIARLGGWGGYASQRPPGEITLKRGLEKFKAIYIGWQLNKDVGKL
jgi:hypothetical protein